MTDLKGGSNASFLSLLERAPAMALTIYYLLVVGAIIVAVWLFPEATRILPFGGLDNLVGDGSVDSFGEAATTQWPMEGLLADGRWDDAVALAMAMAGTLVMVLPVA